MLSPGRHLHNPEVGSSSNRLKSEERELQTWNVRRANRLPLRLREEEPAQVAVRTESRSSTSVLSDDDFEILEAAWAELVRGEEEGELVQAPS